MEHITVFQVPRVFERCLDIRHKTIKRCGMHLSELEFKIINTRHSRISFNWWRLFHRPYS